MKRKALSMLLCLTVMFTMCFAFGGTAYAAQETQTRQALHTYKGNAPSTITPTTYASYKKDTESVNWYTTQKVTGGYKDFTYTIKMPSKGTLFIQFAPVTGSFYLKSYSATYAGSQDLGDSEYLYMFYVPSAGNVTITFRASGYSEEAQGLFGAFYAAGTKKLSSASSTFYLGSGGYDKTSTFTVKAPSNGYLKIKVIDMTTDYSSVSLKTKGFKGWDSLNSSNNYYTYVGVKKGTYTFSLKYGKLYKVETKFTKVKETSAKSTKSKAAKIKKKATNKGIIPANKTSKKHWYKINNPKNQKLKLYVNAKKMSDAGSIGGLKITVYFPDGSSRSATLYAGESDTFTITYGKIGTKARKGTYRIKVQSSDGGNGYYTLKWK